MIKENGGDMSNVSTFGYSDIGGRPTNEDHGGIYVYTDKIIAVAADGLGGEGGGDIASLIALEELSCCGAEGGLPDRERILSCFQNANEKILKRQQDGVHMKTTAVYLCIYKDRAVWAHIGDSRLYHFYQGRLRDFTLDHSVSQMAVLMEEIERKDIPKHPGRSRLLKALGCAQEETEPQISEPVLLEAGSHAFLLCTDGFWEYLEEDEITEALLYSRTAEEWVNRLRGYITGRCSREHDNNTAMAVIVEI